MSSAPETTAQEEKSAPVAAAAPGHGKLIFVALTAIALIFTVIATPLGMVHKRGDADCYYGVWGSKCGSQGYSVDYYYDKICRRQYYLWKMTSAFSIISIAFALFTVGAGAAAFTGANTKLAAAGLSFFTAGCLLIVWCPWANWFNNEACDGQGSFSGQNLPYAAGFALFVTSFCLEVVASAVAVFLW